MSPREPLDILQRCDGGCGLEEVSVSELVLMLTRRK
jgi:hypothetical protein